MLRIKLIRITACLFMGGMLLLPASMAFALQGGVGGPGGGTGGGGTGGGSGSGNQDGHYVYTETVMSEGTVPSIKISYGSDMSPTKTIKTGTCEVTFEFTVLDEPDKIELEPNEFIEIEFTATLDSFDPNTPYPGYSFSRNGFTIISVTNPSGTFGPGAMSFSGTAKLQYNGPNSTGKHHFLLSVGGVALGGGHAKVVWCSHDAPEPITQISTPCGDACGFPSSLNPLNGT